MKIDYSKPLTAEQAEMVTENHNLIYAFLHKNKLPHDDYYDLAAWGLVRAAQAWCQSEYVRQFAFSTIAFKNMFFITARENKISKRHNIDTPYSLDVITQEGSKESVYSFTPCPRAATELEQVPDKIEIQAMLEQLTSEQKYLLIAYAEGKSQRKLADEIGTNQVSISRKIKKAQVIIREWYQREVAG